MFYSADQCVLCGDAGIAWPDLSWAAVVALIQTDPGFATKFNEAKMIKSGESQQDWCETNVSSNVVHRVKLDTTFWFVPSADLRRLYLCCPADCDIPVATIEGSAGELTGVLVTPSPGDEPYAWKRVTLSCETNLTLKRTILPHSRTLRDEHGREFLKDKIAEKAKKSLGSDAIN